MFTEYVLDAKNWFGGRNPAQSKTEVSGAPGGCDSGICDWGFKWETRLASIGLVYEYEW